ncbi:MAG: pilus assembly protein [Lachnospiraceae bacterium]|nr:pilus assembly protein [Lachnospiraceae bacterium]
MDLLNKRNKTFEDVNEFDAELDIRTQNENSLSNDNESFINNGIKITEDFWEDLWDYISDDNITDIDYNGKDLWIRDCDNNVRKKVDISNTNINKEFIELLSLRISNAVSLELNKENPVLEAETDKLRISVIHESVAVSGRSICIRKTLPYTRISIKNAIESGYASTELLSFIINCIKCHMNIVICGGVGVGKTEAAKFFSQYINDSERVISIEDNLEWHYSQIKPKQDVVEMQVSDIFNYQDSIKACLRQNPTWMMIQEIRGEEAKDFVTALSTGVNSITTLHTDDCRKVPDRIINMVSDRIGADRMEADIYNFLDVAIMISMKIDDNGNMKRYIDQVCLFSFEGSRKNSLIVFNDGMLISKNFSPNIQHKFDRNNIKDPFKCDVIFDNLCEDFIS